MTAGFSALEQIPLSRVANYQPFWAARGHLLQLLNRKDEAQKAFHRGGAASLTDDPALRGYLFKRSASNIEKKTNTRRPMNDTFLTPIEKPHGLIMKLAYYFTRLQSGKVLTPLKVHSGAIAAGESLVLFEDHKSPTKSFCCRRRWSCSSDIRSRESTPVFSASISPGRSQSKRR